MGTERSRCFIHEILDSLEHLRVRLARRARMGPSVRTGPSLLPCKCQVSASGALSVPECPQPLNPGGFRCHHPSLQGWEQGQGQGCAGWGSLSGTRVGCGDPRDGRGWGSAIPVRVPVSQFLHLRVESRKPHQSGRTAPKHPVRFFPHPRALQRRL